MSKTLAELFGHLVKLAPYERDIKVAKVVYQAECVSPGDLFVAWQGSAHDGHSYSSQAVARGAVAVLGQRHLPHLGVPSLVVKDPRRAMGEAAAKLLDEPAYRMRLVGITGTSGKTTCAHLVASLLAHACGAAGIIGTLGQAVWLRQQSSPVGQGWGTDCALTTPQGPDFHQQLAAWHDQGILAAAFEASSIALHQGRLAGAQVDVALMTNLTHEHLDYHGTMQAYLAAKELLFTAHLKSGGVAVFNKDDPSQATLIERHAALAGGQMLCFSAQPRKKLNTGADVWPKEVVFGRQATTIVVATPDGEFTLHSGLIGPFNVENIVAAVAVGCALGLEHTLLRDALEAVHCVPGRLERVAPPNQGAAGHLPVVIVDYAHKPDALKAALTATRAITSGRIICVFGCGGDRDAKKRPMMGQVAVQASDCVIVTNDNPRTEDGAAIAQQIIDGALATGLCHLQREPNRPMLDGKKQLFVELNRAAAIAQAIAMARHQDAVLIAGKGHETYQIIGTQKRNFDDRAIAAKALCDALQNDPGRSG